MSLNLIPEPNHSFLSEKYKAILKAPDRCQEGPPGLSGPAEPVREYPKDTDNPYWMPHSEVTAFVKEEKKEGLWQRIVTAQEIALRAANDYHLSNFGSRTEGKIEGTFDAKTVMGSTSASGTAKIKSDGAPILNGITTDMKSDSGVTISHERTMTECLPNSAESALSVGLQTKDAHCTLTTTREAGVFAAFSVRNATQESESCDTMQFSVCAPPGTFKHPSAKMFYESLFRLALLSARKQADYGRDDDPFSNVRASAEWGVPAWVGAMIRLNDKIRRLQSLALKGKLANESAEDSLRDIAVYAIIALVLREQEGVK